MGTNILPEAIIFDYDGTLVDSERITYELSAPIISKYMGRDFTRQELNSLKGKVWRSAFKQWLPDDHERLYQEIVDNWKSADPLLQLYPEVGSMLEELHRNGVVMAIASSRERKLISRDLERLSIAQYFQAVVGQEDTVNHKPNPDPLLLASELLKINSTNCIYIGDQVSDILASKTAGMFSGGASWGEGEYEILVDAIPDYLFRRPGEILGVFFGS